MKLFNKKSQQAQVATTEPKALEQMGKGMASIPDLISPSSIEVDFRYNQLRGRAGRQGDPGETQFFVSLEDSLMRVFASDAVKRMMGRFGIPEDEPIENRLITRSLEAAQGKIEGVNFDIRKNVLEYDLVLNQQRTTIYQRRRSILVAEPGEVETLLYQFVGDDEDLRLNGHQARTLFNLLRKHYSFTGKDF
jgi:preprotein translocase subunit SecA